MYRNKIVNWINLPDIDCPPHHHHNVVRSLSKQRNMYQVIFFLPRLPIVAQLSSHLPHQTIASRHETVNNEM